MGFFGTLVFFIVVLVGCFWIGMPSEFLAGAVLFFALFWIIGLIPPVLIRFAVARKPLSRGAAIGLAILLWFVNVFILSAIRGQGLTTGGGASIWLVGLTFCTYSILRMGKKDVAKTVVQTPPTRSVVSSESAHSARAKDAGISFVKENSTAMNDDVFYDEVAKELEANKLIPGVWTRAFAEADGDENRAKAIYIKRRVAQLAENSRRQLEEVRRTVVASRERENERWVRNIYANGDVTMSDKNTGRMWLGSANPCGKKKWADAVAYCDNLTYAGYSDWRLPNKDTLEEQFSQTRFFTSVQYGDYWTDTLVSSSSLGWCVDISNCKASFGNTENDYYVWPVRGGQ